MGERQKLKAKTVAVGGIGELEGGILDYKGFYRVWDLR